MVRDRMFRASTLKVISKAPPQASERQLSYGLSANEEMTDGKLASGAFMLKLWNWLFNAVNSSGAVSPAIRARASSTPVITPALTARKRTRVAGFQQAVRHQAQHIVRGTHHHRHGDQRQGDRTGITGEMFNVGHIQRVDEQADHDRWRRQHDVGHKTRDLRQLVFFAVFSQVDTGQHADRGADQGSQAHHHGAADDRVDQTATVAARGWRGLREHVDRHGAEALDDQGEQDPGQHGQAQGHGGHRQGDADAVHQQTLAVDRIHGRLGRCVDGGDLAHFVPSLRDMPASISLAADKTMRVMTNRISASENSEDTCSADCASPNSLASSEVMLLPGANSDHDSLLVLPITKVTAMVSPSARPRPSMTPPTTPVLV